MNRSERYLALESVPSDHWTSAKSSRKSIGSDHLSSAKSSSSRKSKGSKTIGHEVLSFVEERQDIGTTRNEDGQCSFRRDRRVRSLGKEAQKSKSTLTHKKKVEEVAMKTRCVQKNRQVQSLGKETKKSNSFLKSNSTSTHIHQVEKAAMKTRCVQKNRRGRSLGKETQKSNSTLKSNSTSTHIHQVEKAAMETRYVQKNRRGRSLGKETQKSNPTLRHKNQVEEAATKARNTHHNRRVRSLGREAQKSKSTSTPINQVRCLKMEEEESNSIVAHTCQVEEAAMKARRAQQLFEKAAFEKLDEKTKVDLLQTAARYAKEALDTVERESKMGNIKLVSEFKDSFPRKDKYEPDICSIQCQDRWTGSEEKDWSAPTQKKETFFDSMYLVAINDMVQIIRNAQNFFRGKAPDVFSKKQEAGTMEGIVALCGAHKTKVCDQTIGCMTKVEESEIILCATREFDELQETLQDTSGCNRREFDELQETLQDTSGCNQTFDVIAEMQEAIIMDGIDAICGPDEFVAWEEKAYRERCALQYQNKTQSKFQKILCKLKRKGSQPADDISVEPYTFRGSNSYGDLSTLYSYNS